MPDQLKFTPGEKYQTRDGRPALYVGTRANGRHILEIIDSGCLLCVNDDGSTASSIGNGELDIIGPYREPIKMKRGTVLPWFWGVAMDRNGTWFMFLSEPHKYSDAWAGDHQVYLPPEYAPKNYTGYWADSPTPIDQIEWVD